MSSTALLDRHSRIILATTILWGTYWIPLRAMDELGSGSVYFIGASIFLPLLYSLPWLLRHRRRIFTANAGLWILGLNFAISMSFYAEGALRGNVARVILLFYLTPVWSTLLARIMLNEPITPQRILTLVLGLFGMFVILGGDSGLPIPQDLSEWFGLIAGISWGLAMVFTQKNKNLPLKDSVSVIFLCFFVVFLVLTLVPNGRHWVFDPTSINLPAIAWIVAFGVLWSAPAITLTIYGATEVEPGKVAILLMMEVVIGIATAAWLTDEHFGVREFVGAILIMSAGITEFIPLGKLRGKVHSN